MKVYHHRVQYYETDKMGIVHHSNYIRWMEEARVDLLSQIGWAYDRLEEMGIISPVVSVECRYIIPTAFAQDIYIKVTTEEFRGVRLKLKYEMRNSEGTLVCEGHSEHCFLTPEGSMIRVKTGYPELYEALVRCQEETI